MFKEYWRLCQKFWIPEENEKYWDSVIKEINEFMKKYESEIFSKYLGLSLIDMLENKYKTKNKGGSINEIK